jgi:hypothetical protein
MLVEPALKSETLSVDYLAACWAAEVWGRGADGSAVVGQWQGFVPNPHTAFGLDDNPASDAAQLRSPFLVVH